MKSDNLQNDTVGWWDSGIIVLPSDGPMFILIDWEYFCVTVHRGAFCQFSFRWIYYYGSDKSNGKETEKTHLCLCAVGCRLGLMALKLISSKWFAMILKIVGFLGQSAKVSKSVKIWPFKLIFYFKKHQMFFDICRILFILTFFEAIKCQKWFPICQNISNLETW